METLYIMPLGSRFVPTLLQVNSPNTAGVFYYTSYVVKYYQGKGNCTELFVKTCFGYWTIRGYANSWTGQLTDAASISSCFASVDILKHYEQMNTKMHSTQ